MKISVGPILYYWPKQQVLDFYQRLLDSSVDIIYLGEAVCSKRHELRIEDWIELAVKLNESGKQVVLSTLALIEARSELSGLQKICSNNAGILVEANDMAAVQMLSEKGLPFVSGSSINIYNAHTLKILQQQGMQRWVMPVELNRETLSDILTEAKAMGYLDQIETEVFAYGKLPLAYSARCFTARMKNLPKDDCRYSCIDYPDGVVMETQEDQELFTLNGIQTQSGYCYNLLPQLPEMINLGVDVVRISPQFEGTEQVVQQFRNSLDKGKVDTGLIARQHCNGYWFGQSGMSTVQDG
ncbi:MAG: U32 family peptidase [Pseudomonadales bacterium]|nr:U32 family peptidase [Pseudomonadales bacterium]MCP5213985.1 U32 family peptidase [Pseudomonadales bacterium]MCP5302807.1 U32 family peptidase [Pseudomonadales bacterium]